MTAKTKKKEKKENPNDECLEGMRCPNPDCDDPFGPFIIEITTTVEVSDEGVGEQTGDNEWSEESYCQCDECGHTGTVKDFREENQTEPRRGLSPDGEGESKPGPNEQEELLHADCDHSGNHSREPYCCIEARQTKEGDNG